MIYQISKIIEDVRVCIDENTKSDGLLEAGDIETLSLEEIIKSKILEAVQRIHCMAPAYMLDGGNNFADAIYWADQASGWALLPKDFMRLVVFEMDDWERAVYSAISVDDEEYKLQRSRFKALRGNPQRPVCAIGIRPEGKVLEFYSCKNEDACVSRAVYLPFPSIDEYGGVEVCERCYTSVVYTAAGLVLITLGEVDKGNNLSNLGQTFIS